MIPILYQGNETHFLHNGLGRLSDAISCKVVEERNGVFELEMTYPITGIHYDDIAVNEIIYAKTEDGGTNQAFIIYKISKPLNGIVTINAQHISYVLNGVVVMPYSAVSLADAMAKINDYSVVDTGFTYYTDISSSVPFTLSAPRSVRNLLGGEQGSLLDTYGGYDYKFDNFNVRLLAHRGNDNGVTIRYGKNLTDLKAVTNTTSIYTGIVPYWADTEGNTVYADPVIVWSSYHGTYPYDVIKTMDFSGDFEEKPTSSQLTARANSYLASNSDCGEISANIEVSFVSLAQTDEYKDIAPLERVKLCDTVTVQYGKLGVYFKTKVIKTEYNVLLERYDAITLGSTTYTLAKAIESANQTPTIAETTSAIQKAVNRASDLIRGGLGGHVVMVADGDGLPQEILIMDADNIQQAQRLWRWNLNGFGYSSTGYEGDYGTAITMDGEIVADFITAGHFNGEIIEAGTISADALSVEAKEELAATHNYLSNDIFTDLSVWEHGVVAPYYETIDGKTYIVLDGTGISAFSDQYYIRTKTNTMGDIHFDVNFTYHIDRQVTITERQRYPYVYYIKTDGTWSLTWKWLPTQTIPADTDFTWDVAFNLSDVDPEEYSYFGFYFIPNCKVYIETLSVTSTVDVYATSGMQFTNKGLQMLVEETSIHNYLPFDVMTNPDRWKHTGNLNGYSWGYTTITVDGKTTDAIMLDGTDAHAGFDFMEFFIETDLIGKPTATLSFKYRFASNYTFASDTWFSYIDIDTGSGHGTGFVNEITAGTQYTANSDHSWSRTAILPVTADYYEGKSVVKFKALAGVLIYIYDVTLTGDSDTYKKASLSYTSDGLNSVVQAGAIISTINQSAESVSIEADKINLTGNLSLKGQFQAFDVNDDTNYIDMTDGAISIYNQGDNVFTVASTALLGNRAGIFFGDASDSSQLLSHTHIDSTEMSAPWIYNYMTGDYEGRLGQTDTAYSVISMVVEGSSEFYQNVYFRSDESGILSCSMPAYFYANVYNSGGSVVFVSDKRKKKSIKDLVIDKAKSFVMGLKPRMFKFKDGTSDRYHHGFIAQEVHDVMDDDWGVYCEDKETDFIGLRYDELIADMVKVIQDQEKRINELERKVNDLTKDKP